MRPLLGPEGFSEQSKRACRHQRFLWTRFLLAMGIPLFGVAGCAHHMRSAQSSAQTPMPQSGGPASLPRPSSPPPRVELQPAVPGEYAEEGVASWYGIPFDGHRTSNGEIYDMHQFTAAHRTLPFGSFVRVTNLTNGKQTEVRINDRGPFVADRVIDLSLAAAQAIEMVGPGIAQVRLELVSGPNPMVGVFGVQVGAFLMRENAERLRTQLEDRYAPIGIVTYDSPNGLFYRVRVGRVTSPEAAQDLADQLHSNEQLTTFVVRLDQ